MWTIYQHHKGMHYLTLGKALHSESMESQTVYIALYDNPHNSMWVRPSSMFFDNGGPRGGKRFSPSAVVRKLALHESEQVLNFGFDAWGDGRTQSEFIDSYKDNLNHLRGQRFVLENTDGGILSTVNTLRLTADTTGLAWLATHPEHRKQGHATILMHAVMALLRHENPDMSCVLHSEIGVRYFERFGFEKASVEHQHFEKSVAMVAAHDSEPAGLDRLLKEFF